MDCVDCHNRPAHNYRSPEFEVDLALSEGRIDSSLPYIRREGVRILTEKVYESHEAAREGIAAATQAFYAQNYPDLAESEAVAQAGKALGDAYSWNNFPHMKVTWNLYPNHIGHQDSAGLLPLPRQQAQDRRRRQDRQEVRHLPQHRGRGREQLRAAAGTRAAGGAARAGGGRGGHDARRRDGHHGHLSRGNQRSEDRDPGSLAGVSAFRRPGATPAT